MISFDISKQPTYQAITNALKQALEVSSDCPFRRTFHSDQVWAYQMKNYVFIFKSHKIIQSMNRKGNCHDNSVMENFFGLLKEEIYYGSVLQLF
ncbi:transposase family protein [Lactococcus sp. dk322]|nr:DDE-type integrase/transposase/recombinase [Lactococcus sp. dk101]TXK36690.1 transposase family protein [Lactococcus sp. dk310]TXK46480.1 transposase family protein [Lactococcus sp. dk322]